MTAAQQTSLHKAWREYVHAVLQYRETPLRSEWQAVLAKEAAMEDALRACQRQGSLFEDEERS